MSSYKKFTKDIGIIGLTNLTVVLKGLVILPFITKLLGVENYGIWVQLGITLSLVVPIALLGLPASLVRFLAAEKDKKEIQEGIYSVLALIFAIALTISLLMVIASGPIANFFQCQPILVKVLAFVILLECLNSVILNIFRAFQEIRKYSSFVIFQSLGEVGLIILAVILGYGLPGIVVSLLIIRMAIFLITFPFILKRIGIKIPNFSRTKEYLSFGLPTVASSASYWTVTSSDRYLISFFLGTLFVGYYAPAYTLGNIINFFVFPFIVVLPAILSRFFDENKIKEVKNCLKYSLKYFLMITIPAAFGLSILSRQILTIFSTREIASNAYFITPFVVLSILLYGVGTIFIQILTIFKKTKIFGHIWMCAAIINLGLNFILIPKLGILGAAITTLSAYSFAFLLIWYYSFKYLRFDIDWQFILKSVLASVLMGLFIIWFSPLGLLKTVIAVILGATIYGILILLLKGFDRKELEFLKGFLGK